MTHFGTTKDDQDIAQLNISAGDISVNILAFGAIVQEVFVSGHDQSLALGSHDIADYEADMRYFGAIVGPIANRISNARVRLDGMMYELERNENNAVHLHSGKDGVHAKVWQVAAQSADSVTLTLGLADGVAGLPGQRKITVTYTVAAPATLTMTIDGTTDTATCMNFASHIYWNLDGSDSFAGHMLRLDADHYLPVNDATCPTGDVLPVQETDMDFRQPRALVKGAPSLDHNFCLSDSAAPLRDVLWLTGQSGLQLTVATTEPGVQIHDAASSHRPNRPTFEGLVIEPQRWPDAPNHRGFGSITVTPDRPYHQMTRWTFDQ